MEELFFLDTVFEKQNELAKGEYEQCMFNNCDFSELDFSKYKFLDCVFKNSNLSLCKLNNTILQNINFIDCKLLGVHFENCVTFGISFSFANCVLNHASFYKLKIKNTNFKNCSLKETDFVEADITSGIFENCDLLHAQFDRTILENADLRTSYNYNINPETNRIKKAKFSLLGLEGLLHNYDIIIEK